MSTLPSWSVPQCKLVGQLVRNAEVIADNLLHSRVPSTEGLRVAPCSGLPSGREQSQPASSAGGRAIRISSWSLSDERSHGPVPGAAPAW